MKIDLHMPESWEQVNAIYRQVLGIAKPEIGVRAYLGLNHAVWEIAQGLAQLFPHRRHIAYVSQNGPYFDPTVTALSREGYTVKALTLDDLTTPESWFETLAKDLLFVLYATDDPLTGELFEIEPFERYSKDKRVFRMAVSHSRHIQEPALLAQPPALYDIKIHSLRSDRAVAVLGEKSKLNSFIAANLCWNRLDPAEARKELEPVQTHGDRVLAFEASPPAGAKAFFKPGTPRILDRAVIYWEDTDGFAFISELAHLSGFSLHEPGCDGRLETASLCRWESARLTGWLLNRGFAPEVLRGLVMISGHMLTEELISKIPIARAKVLELQG